MAKWTPSPNFLPGNTSMGTAPGDLHQFTGSVDVSGSVISTGLSASFLSTDISSSSQTAMPDTRTFDGSTHNIFKLDYGTMSNLELTGSNLVAGATYLFIFENLAGLGFTVSYDPGTFKFSGGAAPSITDSAGAIDILSGISDGSFIYASMTNDFQTVP
tara:strand:+ start:24 stop:500 length:477 start_codon:yes stop_codon:yes gene_type:complete